MFKVAAPLYTHPQRVGPRLPASSPARHQVRSVCPGLSHSDGCVLVIFKIQSLQ